MKETIRYLVPPFMMDSARLLKRVIGQQSQADEWEFVPEGWRAEETNPKIKGWNVNSVLEAYKKNWPGFVQNLKDTSPIDISLESDATTRANLALHNIVISYGYALTLSSRNKSRISMLDWGGGIGHYYLIGRTLAPGLQIDYHCKDVSVLIEHGRQLFPEAHFYNDESCLERLYDFIVVSCSLHYSREWRATVAGLARATGGYLFVTQLPVVRKAPSFVMVQRPYNYGYDTEYLSWCLNRDEFLEQAEAAGLRLTREFICGYQPFVRGAPEQCEYRGYLFRPNHLNDGTAQEPQTN